MGFISELFGKPHRSKKPILLPEDIKLPEPISDRPMNIPLNRIPTLIASGVNPIGMSYWRNINQHKDDPHLKVFLSIDDQINIFTIDKTTLKVIDQKNLEINHTGEGCYFSAHHSWVLYIPIHSVLYRLNINTGAYINMAWNLTLEGPNNLWQCHSDYEEMNHSATIKDPDYKIVGWAVHNEISGLTKYYDLKGEPDECQIDKSGNWLLIKEDDYNRIIYLPTGVERLISNEEGALGHSDIGFDFAMGENDHSSIAGALDRIRFNDGSHQLIYSTGIWNMGYVSYTNAKPNELYNACCLITTPTELIKVQLSTGEGSVVCSNLTQSDEYNNRAKANLCSQGEYAVWTAYVDGSLNAYIVKI